MYLETNNNVHTRIHFFVSYPIRGEVRSGKGTHPLEAPIRGVLLDINMYMSIIIKINNSIYNCVPQLFFTTSTRAVWHANVCDSSSGKQVPHA